VAVKWQGNGESGKKKQPAKSVEFVVEEDADRKLTRMYICVKKRWKEGAVSFTTGNVQS